MIQNVNSCWLNVTSLIHELATGNRDVTITIVHVWFTWKLSYHNGMKPQWFKEFVKRTSVPSFASFITKKICGSLNCLTSGVIINWPRAMCMAQLDISFGHIAATVQHHWTCRCGYLDHAFKLHYTISPHWVAVMHRWTRWQHQMHFRATLLMMVIEIRFNFQICVQCTEKAISKITFNIRWNSPQIWCSWPTWVSKGNIKGFENNGVWVAW